MEGFGGALTPSSFPPDTLAGRSTLVLLGIAMTLVTQSSSAGVVAAITAVHVGTISLPQACAMVIGMDVGTTFTAVIAAIGGSVNARRTGIAHVVYNVMTGIGAFVTLPLFVTSWESFAPQSIRCDAEIALASFHTLFNAVGIVIVLPFTNRFAKLIVWLVPSRSNTLARRLDPSFLDHANIAIDSVDATLREIVDIVFRSLKSLLGHNGDLVQDDLRNVLVDAERAVEATRSYLSQITSVAKREDPDVRHIAALHVIDHLSRLIQRCRTPQQLPVDAKLQSIRLGLASVWNEESKANVPPDSMNRRLELIWNGIEANHESLRRKAIHRAANRMATADETLASLDAVRWLRRVCYHVWRISHHLQTLGTTPQATSTSRRLNTETAPEDPE